LKFQPDTLAGVNSITRHDAHRIQVGGQGFEHSLVVPWRGDVGRWPCDRVADLAAGHFERLLALRPELVIFGSGSKLQFISPALYRCLIDQRIGMETMDTAAACRTYNVLAHEGRAVVAALICEPCA
jgi:uncharacterized protein